MGKNKKKKQKKVQEQNLSIDSKKKQKYKGEELDRSADNNLNVNQNQDVKDKKTSRTSNEVKNTETKKSTKSRDFSDLFLNFVVIFAILAVVFSFAFMFKMFTSLNQPQIAHNNTNTNTISSTTSQTNTATYIVKPFDPKELKKYHLIVFGDHGCQNTASLIGEKERFGGLKYIDFKADDTPQKYKDLADQLREFLVQGATGFSYLSPMVITTDNKGNVLYVFSGRPDDGAWNIMYDFYKKHGPMWRNTKTGSILELTPSQMEFIKSILKEVM